MRPFKEIDILVKAEDKEAYLSRILFWAEATLPVYAYFRGNDAIPYPKGGFPEMVMLGFESRLSMDSFKNPVAQFHYGFFEYANSPGIGKYQWGEAEASVQHTESGFKLIAREPEVWQKAWEAFALDAAAPSITAPFFITKPSEETYTKAATQLKEHIQRGDIYEANLCVKWELSYEAISPLGLFLELYQKQAMPFSVYLKVKDLHCLCLSPERYLQANKGHLLSQPMKGTAARYVDPAQDQASAESLANSIKERTENTMIVDLVRNDLSHFASPGSVNVTSFCQVHALPNVHQMISAVEADLENPECLFEAFSAAFPMGSMTGAPKHKAMKLLNELEGFERGLYSGSIGYQSPQGLVDFNVVIRSLLVDIKSKQMQYCAGSAITAMAEVEAEFRECNLKARILDTLFTIH